MKLWNMSVSGCTTQSFIPWYALIILGLAFCIPQWLFKFRNKICARKGKVTLTNSCEAYCKRPSCLRWGYPGAFEILKIITLSIGISLHVHCLTLDLVTYVSTSIQLFQRHPEWNYCFNDEYTRRCLKSCPYFK